MCSICTLNQDEEIILVIEEKEGSQYISRFEVKVAGINDVFLLEDYDASFEKLEVFDFNHNSVDDLVILFDTHGSGGQGTHDIFVLSIVNNSLKIYSIGPSIEVLIVLDDSWNVDQPYDIYKVYCNGVEEMLIRQYVWGGGGRSDYVGDLVSIVTWDKENDIIRPIESWLEDENNLLEIF